MRFEDELSAERAKRVVSLSNSRALYITSSETLRDVGAKSLIVMCYAHWEGFFNFCVDRYVDYVNSLNREIILVRPELLACEVDPHLMSLKDRNFRIELRGKFARAMFDLQSCSKIVNGKPLLKAASNLDFDRLRDCLTMLGVAEDRFLPHRNFIAHELVKWRHQVAHRDEPTLDSADLLAHSHRTEELLVILSESFSDTILGF
jgi:hypothetical protein